MQKILHFQAITGISPNQNKDLTSTYSQTQKSKEEHIETNIKYCKTCDLKTTEQDKTLPIMYWLPKMYKTPIGARFIVASKNCSTKPLPYIISKVFKMILNHVESFYRKSLVSSCKFCLQIKNSNPHWLFKNINLLDIKRLWKKIFHKTNFD